MNNNQRAIAGVLGAIFVLAGFGLYPVPSHSSIKGFTMIMLWAVGLVFASAAMRRVPHSSVDESPLK